MGKMMLKKATIADMSKKSGVDESTLITTIFPMKQRKQ